MYPQSGQLIRICIQMYPQSDLSIWICIRMYPQSGLLIRIHICCRCLRCHCLHIRSSSFKFFNAFFTLCEVCQHLGVLPIEEIVVILELINPFQFFLNEGISIVVNLIGFEVNSFVSPWALGKFETLTTTTFCRLTTTLENTVFLNEFF